ncbi:ABC transporter transmembrane domain-containing protein [Propionibacteriaceae bacterium Y1923]|uniref:ABC transporter transmembrane domain-containing protein n=1 Tax=Aestuariimicrobium sp. Y1814 TaxID=3418742 RepID=UPI003C1B0789
MQTFPPRVHAYGLPATHEGPLPVDLPSTPETPDTRSPARFMLWLMWQSRGLVAITTLLAICWYVPNGLTPWFLGRTIDSGVASGNLWTTVGWAAVLAVNIAFASISGTLMHTTGVSQWLAVFNRSMMLTNRKAMELGHHLPRRAPTGEVLSVAMSDSDIFGAVTEVTNRAVASVLAILVVAVVVLQESTRLGLIVLIATPLMVIASGPLLGPLSRARTQMRSRSSTLTGMATDIVAGLRILRGIGGERTFGDNYARQSQLVRQSGDRAAPWQAGVDAMATLMSGGLMVVIVWLGARDVISGALTPGQLVSFFGYAVFLVGPVNTLFQFINRWTQGLVSAEKALGLLRQEVPWTEPSDPVDLPLGEVIIDQASGVVARPGELTILVSAVPEDSAAVCDRIGRYLADDDEVALAVDTDLNRREAKAERRRLREERARQAQRDRERAVGRWGVSVGGVDLSQVPIEQVRQHIVVSDAQAGVFAGTLQNVVDPHGQATREQAEQALLVANAEDVYEAVPGGWAGRVDERGRGLSGGQRQRLVLARGLLLDPDVLVLVEPTSAVDAHTEARIAQRVPAHRRGRTTIVTTVSPLWLHQADRVVLMKDGVCVATGRHDQLMRNPDYRGIVARGVDLDEEVLA